MNAAVRVGAATLWRAAEISSAGDAGERGGGARTSHRVGVLILPQRVRLAGPDVTTGGAVEAAHTPAAHTSPSAHAWPQAPQ
jgi:hypothetical protein